MPLTKEELEVVKQAAGEAAAESLKKKMDAADGEFQKAVETATKGKASSQELIAIQEKQEAVEKELKGIIAEQGKSINKLKEGNSETEKADDMRTNIKKGLAAAAAELKTMSEKSSGSIRIKAATTISTANFGAGVIRGIRETDINKRQLRERYIMGLISILNGGPGSDPLSWIERRPKEGGAAFVAEGDAKPKVDFTYTEGKMTSEYLAVTTPVSRKALVTMPVLEQEINEVLDEELMDFLEEAIVRNSAASASVNSIWSYAKSFTGASLAGIINNANYFDVLRAAILQARKGNTGDIKARGFIPNAFLISLDIEAAMDLEKAADGHYLLPPFMTPNGTAVKGVRVIGQEFLGDDEFIGGDFTRYLFNIVDGVSVDVGFIDQQFVKNEMTVRAEMMGNGRVKYHDTWAFVKGDFTTAKAALETP